jgi:hypothetical protein
LPALLDKDTRVVEHELAWPRIFSTPPFKSSPYRSRSRGRRSISGQSISATPPPCVGELERYSLLVPVY